MALLDCGASILEQHGVTLYEELMGNGFNTDAAHAVEENDLGDVGLVGSGVGTKTSSGSIAQEVLRLVDNSGQDERHDWIKHFYIAYDALEKYYFLI